jgi:hypothetical protein
MERRQNYIAGQLKSNKNCEQSGDTYSCCVVAPVGSPPPKPTGGLTAFPDSATKIFVLPQNTLTLAFNATKSQLCNPRIWRRLKRIFAMLAKERKEAKEVLWEFLGFDDDDGDEVEICAKVLLMQRWFEERFAYFCEKPPPNTASNAWLSAVVPRLRRAPSSAALRCVGGCVFFHAA